MFTFMWMMEGSGKSSYACMAKRRLAARWSSSRMCFPVGEVDHEQPCGLHRHRSPRCDAIISYPLGLVQEVRDAALSTSAGREAVSTAVGLIASGREASWHLDCCGESRMNLTTPSNGSWLSCLAGLLCRPFAISRTLILKFSVVLLRKLARNRRKYGDRA